ncbi:MAG: glycoside hydrolase [Ruminococcaceae bacterium]|nr:glycoside hydrolase [Oscillospiraceae bacterium]
MKKITLGTPEKFVPSMFCEKFNYCETKISYPTDRFTYKQTKRGFLVEFPLEDDAQIFGFGLQLQQLEFRRCRVRTAPNADPRTRNGDSHAPVPFFVTTKGYGMYFDTTRWAEFYCGKTHKGSNIAAEQGESKVMTSTDELYAAKKVGSEVMQVLIPAAEGVDIYIIEGDTILDIVKQYNMLSGGGCDVPEWGLGVMYRCFTEYNQNEILDMARYFREKDIPCHVLGLEPGWQSHAYSCSHVWSERYPDPKGMIEELKKMGYHLNLWEHAFTHPTSPIYEELSPYCGDFLTLGGIVPDFATKEARKIFADHQREYLVNIGVDGFKLDECDCSDNNTGWSFPNTTEFPSGMDGEQYHSMFGTLYAQTIMDALGDTKTYSQVRNMGALAASYPFVLYSDLYDHEEFIRGVVTSSFGGVLWTPELRDAESKEELLRRMQGIVFSAQCLINAWFFAGAPWARFDCEDEVRELLKIRESLMPMLKEAFDEYRDTGKPPVRALVMEYTDDAETYRIDDEYMFCDDLLVAPMIWGKGDTREVYLPTADKWVDYFTGEPVEAGKFSVTTKGIPVYRRIK